MQDGFKVNLQTFVAQRAQEGHPRPNYAGSREDLGALYPLSPIITEIVCPPRLALLLPTGRLGTVLLYSTAGTARSRYFVASSNQPSSGSLFACGPPPFGSLSVEWLQMVKPRL